MFNNPLELENLLPQVMADYNADQRFFADYQLPEYVILEELSLNQSERARFLTFTCVTNHIHDDTGQSKQTAGSDCLWQTCGALWRDHQWVYDPEQLVGDDRKNELTALFESLEIMDQRDPDWWYRTAMTLEEHWEGDVVNLLATPNPESNPSPEERFDAPTIAETIIAHDIPALGGKKIRPLWLRLMHEEIHELTRIEEISIPVDFHIVGISNRLTAEDTKFNRYDDDDKDTLRTFWQIRCQANDLIPVEVDKALWLLHKYWDQGGRKYVAETLRLIRSQ